MQPTPSWWHTAWLVATFAGVVLFAGHGLAPIGLLLVAGWSDTWILAVITGWLSIIVLVFGRALFVDRRGYLFAGAVLSAGSWALFMLESQNPFASLAFSVPYIAALILWINAGRLSRARLTVPRLD